jgi:hypothetical protein
MAILHISRLHGQGGNIHGHDVIIVTTESRISLLPKVDLSAMILQKNLERDVEDLLGSDTWSCAMGNWSAGTYFQFEYFPHDDLFTPLQLLSLMRGETIAAKDCGEEVQNLLSM